MRMKFQRSLLFYFLVFLLTITMVAGFSLCVFAFDNEEESHTQTTSTTKTVEYKFAFDNEEESYTDLLRNKLNAQFSGFISQSFVFFPRTI